jgi:glycosyltransferase involved in cell wall biosynthesis
MLNKPLISIITPTYNHEKYIGKCIDSVLAQDYPNWEQIIIDDGSTDNTRNIIANYNDKRIKYFKQDNLGVFNLKKTYNKALKLSEGEYIAILEGDYYWPEYKLKEQIKDFQNQNVILVFGNAQAVKDNGEIEGLLNKPKLYQKITAKYETMDKLLLRNFIPACTVLCDKNALLNIGGFEQPPNSPCVDYSTWLQLSKLGNFYYEDNVMGYWRKHDNQQSLKHAFSMYKSHDDYAIKFFKNLSKDEKNLLNINLNDIKKKQIQMLSDLNFDLGRKSLNKKDWDISRKYFRKALNGTNRIKIYATVGIICSFLKIDLEGFVPILNKIKF